MFTQPLSVSVQNFSDIFTRQGYSETVFINGVFAGAEL